MRHESRVGAAHAVMVITEVTWAAPTLRLLNCRFQD